jgi:hypothetical protein
MALLRLDLDGCYSRLACYLRSYSYPHIDVWRPSHWILHLMSKTTDCRIERVCNIIRINVLGIAPEYFFIY